MFIQLISVILHQFFLMNFGLVFPLQLDQEEPWLPQYMLGKVAEKRGEAPLVFLQHYRAAAKLLFDSNAEYPLSLNYEPTQHYAYEAHEVYFFFIIIILMYNVF